MTRSGLAAITAVLTLLVAGCTSSYTTGVPGPTHTPVTLSSRSAPTFLPSSTAPSISTAAIDGLVPPDTTATQTAHGCAPVLTPVVTVTINPDGPLPVCAIVEPAQWLRLVNATNGFHQRGESVTIRFADLPPRTLSIGHRTTYDMPFSSYLAPGQHFIQMSAFGNSNFVIWLR